MRYSLSLLCWKCDGTLAGMCIAKKGQDSYPSICMKNSQAKCGVIALKLGGCAVKGFPTLLGLYSDVAGKGTHVTFL